MLLPFRNLLFIDSFIFFKKILLKNNYRLLVNFVFMNKFCYKYIIKNVFFFFFFFFFFFSILINFYKIIYIYFKKKE